MLSVIQIRPVKRFALPLVNRPGIAVPEPLKFICRPGDRPPCPAGGVDPRGHLSGARIEPGDGADIAIADVALLVGVDELHPVTDS